MKPKTRVVFRKVNTGEVIALFPDIPGGTDPHTCSSYTHVGQHGSASASLSLCTEPVSRAEYRPLARELRRAGYRLDVRQRVPPDARRIRLEQIKTWAAS